MAKATQPKILSFKSQTAWQRWLDKNHLKSDGIWLRFYKKKSGIKSVYYPQALEEALCYGWIDSQLKSYDEVSYLQKFTPRRKKSVWSKVNTLKVQKLIEEGRMKTAGHAQIKAAKDDGRWDKAYHSSSTMELPEDFLKLLSKYKRAHAFYHTLPKQHKYAIAYRLQEAKLPETKKKRMKFFIELLKRKEKFSLM